MSGAPKFVIPATAEEAHMQLYRADDKAEGRDVSTELLHSIEEALDWAAKEAQTSASYCTLASDTQALEARAASLEDILAQVQGVLRARHEAQKDRDPHAFRVRWEIDLEADSPLEAAEKALAIHRSHESIATVFDVTDGQGQTTTIDLNPEES